MAYQEWDIETIWNECAVVFRRMAMRQIGNHDDAEECVQEIFAKICTATQRRKLPERRDSWLYAVARNAITDHIRKQGRQGRDIPLEYDVPVEEPDEVLEERRSLAGWLPTYIAALKPEYRDALVQCHLDNRRFVDIARTLRITVSGAKSRVRRGRRELARILARDCREEIKLAGLRIE